MFDFCLDREVTTPTTVDFTKEVRDRDRYRKSNISTTGQKNLKMLDLRLDRQATTPTTLDFLKEVRDRDRYRKSTTSTTGQKI